MDTKSAPTNFKADKVVGTLLYCLSIVAMGLSLLSISLGLLISRSKGPDDWGINRALTGISFGTGIWLLLYCLVGYFAGKWIKSGTAKGYYLGLVLSAIWLVKGCFLTSTARNVAVINIISMTIAFLFGVYCVLRLYGVMRPKILSSNKPTTE